MAATPETIHKALERILPEVTKPARYTGGEPGSIVKDWTPNQIKVVLAYPDTYEIGMSNLAIQIIYKILNSQENCLAERVFAPWMDMEAKLRESAIPLYSLESKHPLGEFDLIGFAVAYELHYSNVLNMLDMANLPIRSEKREWKSPLIFAGGPSVVSPEPLAPFIDFFIIGDAEEIILDVFNAVKNWKNPEHSDFSLNRRDFLVKLSEIQGIYVPSLYKEGKPIISGIPYPIQKRVTQDINRIEYPTEPIIPLLDIVHDRAVVEVMRGCPRKCRFCQPGFVTKPVRQMGANRAVELASKLLENTGYDELTLMSLSTSDHKSAKKMTEELAEKYKDQNISISLPSMRADTFAIELAKSVQAVRPSGVTIAPEAGTQRMRNVIDKELTEEEIMRAAARAFEYGANTLKVYFIIGLPTETDEDLQGIVDLVEKILAEGKKNVSPERRHRLKINIGLSTFVPKPHTPFQWESQITISETLRKQKYLKDRLRNRQIQIRWHDAEGSQMEGIFSRGDRKLGDVLETAWRLGCKMDAWGESLRFDLWQKAFEQCGINPSDYNHRQFDYDEPLPWDHIDTGLTKEYLRRDSEKARAAATKDAAGLSTKNVTTRSGQGSERSEESDEECRVSGSAQGESERF